MSLDEIVNQGGVTIFGLPRVHSDCLPKNILDLRIEKQFEIISGQQFRITADIFNALNAGYATAVQTEWDLEDYGQPTDFIGPAKYDWGCVTLFRRQARHGIQGHSTIIIVLRLSKMS